MMLMCVHISTSNKEGPRSMCQSGRNTTDVTKTPLKCPKHLPAVADTKAIIASDTSFDLARGKLFLPRTFSSDKTHVVRLNESLPPSFRQVRELSPTKLDKTGLRLPSTPPSQCNKKTRRRPYTRNTNEEIVK